MELTWLKCTPTMAQSDSKEIENYISVFHTLLREKYPSEISSTKFFYLGITKTFMEGDSAMRYFLVSYLDSEFEFIDGISIEEVIRRIGVDLIRRKAW